MLVICDHGPMERRIALASAAAMKGIKRVGELMAELDAMTRDRDAWKQAHEDLLEVRRQDLVAMQARIDRAEGPEAGG